MRVKGQRGLPSGGDEAHVVRGIGGWRRVRRGRGPCVLRRTWGLGRVWLVTRCPCPPAGLFVPVRSVAAFPDPSRAGQDDGPGRHRGGLQSGEPTAAGIPGVDRGEHLGAGIPGGIPPRLSNATRPRSRLVSWPLLGFDEVPHSPTKATPVIQDVVTQRVITEGIGYPQLVGAPTRPLGWPAADTVLRYDSSRPVAHVSRETSRDDGADESDAATAGEVDGTTQSTGVPLTDTHRPSEGAESGSIEDTSDEDVSRETSARRGIGSPAGSATNGGDLTGIVGRPDTDDSVDREGAQGRSTADERDVSRETPPGEVGREAANVTSSHDDADAATPARSDAELVERPATSQGPATTHRADNRPEAGPAMGDGLPIPNSDDVSLETSTAAAISALADALPPGDSDSPLAQAVAEDARKRITLVGRTFPRPRHTRILTVANQKGGVGKTTTTVNVAAALAQAGARVLVVDLDPQGNASTALGIDHHADIPSIYDVLVDGRPLTDVVQPCPDVPGLFCAPATIDLAGAEIELVSLVARETRLNKAITAYLDDTGGESVDYVVIDCPPSLGLLTINAFVAAREVFIPIQCEYYALEGLSQLLNNIDLIRSHLNPGLHVSSILLTMFDGRTRLAAQVADEVRQHFPQETFRAVIPRSVRISEAPSHGQTVMTYDPNSSGALSYLEAAAEMAERAARQEETR